MPADLPTRRGRSQKVPDPVLNKSRKRPRSTASLAIQGKKRKKRTTNVDATKRVISDATPESMLHRCTCNNCEWQYFSGIRYKCAVCEDYDLCSPCYERNVHDLTHPFMQITKPGGQPTYLPARCKSSHVASSTTMIPAIQTASQPSTVPKHPSSPFFYNTMSNADLKTFLTERGVEFGDVTDNDTLCRRTWDTYCDCMSLVELNSFLSARGISTVGCRDVNSRRQKAKDAFEPPRTLASSDTSPIRFSKGDRVVVTGLKRTEMNGKMAVVISFDNPEGKALVKLEELDQRFKIKLENLKIQVDGEAVEELE